MTTAPARDYHGDRPQICWPSYWQVMAAAPLGGSDGREGQTNDDTQEPQGRLTPATGLCPMGRGQHGRQTCFPGDGRTI
jgi:hypothetical protein